MGKMGKCEGCNLSIKNGRVELFLHVGNLNDVGVQRGLGFYLRASLEVNMQLQQTKGKPNNMITFTARGFE